MFDFQINRRRHSVTKELQGWQVYLPHSCDQWEIAEEDDSHAEAVEQLKSFIIEAQAVLAFLEQAPSDWEGHYGPNKSMRFFDY
jgi:hypothetical protein